MYQIRISNINTSNLKYMWVQGTSTPTEETFNTSGIIFSSGNNLTKSTGNR